MKSNQEALKLKNEGMKLTEEKIYCDAIDKFEEALRVCEEDYPEKYSLLWWVILINSKYISKVF